MIWIPKGNYFLSVTLLLGLRIARRKYSILSNLIFILFQECQLPLSQLILGGYNAEWHKVVSFIHQ